MDTVQLAYDVYDFEETDISACPIIIIHGLLWNKFMFKKLAANTCRVTKRKVYCLDMRGHGESPRSQDLDIVFMVEDVKRFLKDHNMGKVTFMCHSFSCTLAYLVAVDQPESVDKMIMIDHPPFKEFSLEFCETQVYPQFTTPLRMLKSLDPSMSLERARNKFIDIGQHGTMAQAIFLKKMAYDLVKENGVFKYNIDLEKIKERYAVKGYDVDPRGSSDHEILIVRCQDSKRMIENKFEEIRKSNPRARMVTLENTTHILMFEKMELFLQIVNNFLEGKHPDYVHHINVPDKCDNAIDYFSNFRQ